MRPNHQPQQIETVAGPASALGRAVVLHAEKLALICSRRCPADVLLKTYDFARLVRGSGRALVSGFHSAVEKDCLPVLLRGPDPVIIVQAHRLGTTRLPASWQMAINGGQLLLVSPFAEKQNRATMVLAVERNRFVGAISDEILIPYAAPGSNTEMLGLELLAAGKRVYTFSERCSLLMDHGAILTDAQFFAADKPICGCSGYPS